METELAALHRLGNSNVLDVTDNTTAAQELALDKNASHSHELWSVSFTQMRKLCVAHLVSRLVHKHNRIVGVQARLHGRELGYSC